MTTASHTDSGLYLVLYTFCVMAICLKMAYPNVAWYIIEWLMSSASVTLSPCNLKIPK